VIATWLGLLGAGPGRLNPASNTAIMTAVPPGRVAAGGMVDMARGLRTALGVAAITLPLHAVCALAPALARRRVSAGRNSRAVRAGGHDSGAVPR